MSAQYDSVNHSPLNNSPSKQLYSFSKSIRFSPTKQPYCNRSCYDGKKSAFGKRATTFGYGNKTDLVNNNKVPPVGNYQLKDVFSHSKQKRNGYSFSRNKKSSVLVNPQKSKLIPGPGTYEYNRSSNVDKYSNLRYTIGYRTDDPMEKHQNQLGPGQYETIPSISKTGNYFYSRYTSSGCRRIGRSKRPSINSRNDNPGPGAYKNQSKTSLNNTGIYFNSKIRNMEAGKFGKSIRPGLQDRKPVPGPGSYHKFSEFAALNKSWRKISTAGR